MCMCPNHYYCTLDITGDNCCKSCPLHTKLWEKCKSKNQAIIKHSIGCNGYHTGYHRDNRLACFFDIGSIGLIYCKWNKPHQDNA